MYYSNATFGGAVADTCFVSAALDSGVLSYAPYTIGTLLITPSVLQELRDGPLWREGALGEILHVDTTCTSDYRLNWSFESEPDRDATTLAVTLNLPIITTDGNIRKFGKQRGFDKVHGMLWYLKGLVDEGIISKENALLRHEFMKNQGYRIGPEDLLKKML